MPEINDLWFKYRWQLLLGVVGAFLFLLGLISLRVGELFSKEEFEVVDSGDVSREVVVEVTGAVGTPGVYSLESDSRIEDAINAAGGFSGDVDMEYVERMVNRAAKVVDGQKIFIPNQSHDGSARDFEGEVGGVSDVGGIINVNTASQSELESLWGIGPKTAQNVIENRPYSNVEELLERKILKSNVYERNRDLLSVY